ncbi:hypothetical protein GAY31_11375 [Azospirillum brasilense]|nr:hypothetical protein [Azospirillum brasilense]
MEQRLGDEEMERKLEDASINGKPLPEGVKAKLREINRLAPPQKNEILPELRDAPYDVDAMKEQIARFYRGFEQATTKDGRPLFPNDEAHKLLRQTLDVGDMQPGSSRGNTNWYLENGQRGVDTWTGQNLTRNSPETRPVNPDWARHQMRGVAAEPETPTTGPSKEPVAIDYQRKVIILRDGSEVSFAQAK